MSAAPEAGRRPDVAPALVRELLLEGLAVRLRVTGRSMAPHLVDDDEVTLGPCAPASVRLGDLVLWQEPGGPQLLHRVVRRRRECGEGWTFVTKGDALNGPDRPVPGEWVLGRVLAVRRARSGHARADGENGRLARTLAALASRSTPRLFAVLSRLGR